MKHLLAWIQDNRPEDEDLFFGLFMRPPGRRSYEKNGFMKQWKAMTELKRSVWPWLPLPNITPTPENSAWLLAV